MLTDLLSLIKTIFFDWLRLDWVIDTADSLLSDDEFRQERTKGFLKGWVWLMLITIPLIFSFAALIMKGAIVWKILLFVPSFGLFIFFIRLWWKKINGE